MANKKRKKELVRKVSHLVRTEFGGDYQRAFDHYATKRSAEATVDANELRALLVDADVGNALTRSAWVSGIIRELDRDGDGKIAAAEFESAIVGSK
jgi:Ca2+-binding EF-hand superfamily protein